MNQVYNNPLIIRNVKFKEHLTEEEALKKINEFRSSDAGKALPDNKKISLKRIANYFVTHPNFDEVSDDHVLIREGYPVIFTSKNYKKLKYEKSVKREEIDNMNNDGDGVNESINTLSKSDPLKISKQKPRIRDILISKGIDPKPQTLVPDKDGKMRLIEIAATRESYVSKDNTKPNSKKTTAAKKKNHSNVAKHSEIDDHVGTNRVVISLPKKKKKKSTNEGNNATGDNCIQETGLIQESNVEMENVDSSKQSGFNGDKKSETKRKEANGESKDNSNMKKMKKIKNSPTEEKKSENKVVIKTSKKRTSHEHDKINVKKIKVDNSIDDEESNDINSEVTSERKLIQDIDETGLIQGTAKFKIGKVKNNKKDSSKESDLKNNISISSKETIDKDSTNTGNAWLE
ncbi:2069_t:CDS:2 [Rhizophagus irregularis]|nr:2069_t:CDS:2 [Rhizophagus irregularis]